MRYIGAMKNIFIAIVALVAVTIPAAAAIHIHLAREYRIKAAEPVVQQFYKTTTKLAAWCGPTRIGYCSLAGDAVSTFQFAQNIRQAAGNGGTEWDTTTAAVNKFVADTEAVLKVTAR